MAVNPLVLLGGLGGGLLLLAATSKKASAAPTLPGAPPLGSPPPLPGVPPGTVPNPTTPAVAQYVVQAGDWGLSKIAKDFTGDGNRWKELLPLNPTKKRDPKAGFVFHVGDVLNIPQSWVQAQVSGWSI